MLKIRRSQCRLIFNRGIPIPEKDGLYTETGPRSPARIYWFSLHGIHCIWHGLRWISNCIFTASHERHNVPNHWNFDCLFNKLSGWEQRKHKALQYWPFVWRTHRSNVNSSHKGPLVRKVLSCQDVIMNLLYCITSLCNPLSSCTVKLA